MLTSSAKRLELRSHLYRQWASLVEAGVPMVRALHTLGRATPCRRDRRILAETAAAIERGASLAEGIARAGRAMPRLDLALIRVGERTGRLDACLRLLSETTRHQAGLLRDIAGGIAYPVLVVHVAILVFPISALQALVLEGDLGAFVLGKVRTFALLYLVLFLVGWAVPRLFGGTAGRLMEGILRLVPGLGPGLHELTLARLAMTLRAQLDAGIPAVDAWQLAGDVCGSPALGRAIRSWNDPLARGATPGELAVGSRAVGGMFAEFYLNGETSGKLEDALQHIERVYHESGQARLKAFARWLPRLIYAAVMLYVGYAVITFWSGYFNGLMLY